MKVSMHVGELYQKIANHEPVSVGDIADVHRDLHG